MNFLITGGSGFVGRKLVKEISNLKNSKVYVIDKKSYNFNLKNVFFIKADLADLKALKKINIKIDYIYHLAADLGVQKIVKYPLRSLKNNLTTTENIIQLSKIKKIKRLFFFFHK